jgi:hypothetical protein
MRRRTFLNGLALGGLFGFLHLTTGCSTRIKLLQFTYAVPRPDGGVDEVVVEREVRQRDDDGTYTEDIESMTVNGKRIFVNSPEYQRYMSMIYLPAVTLEPWEGNYTLKELGDPSGIRPKGSPNPPIPDPTLGTRPKS